MGTDTVTRREVLRVGGLGLAGLSLPQLLAAELTAGQGAAARIDACVVIFLNGGPSHLDMWDMKPHAPVEIRGEFQPIPTSLTGVQLCEYLPRLARLMHHATLVRSMHHSVNNSHAAAVYAALTGHDRGEQGGGAKQTDYPPPGSVLAKLRPPSHTSLPYVALPFKTQEGAGGPLQPGFLSGFIGPNHDPFWVLRDPNSPKFSVPNLSLPAGVSQDRASHRRHLLSQLDAHLLRLSADPSLDALDGFQHRAFDLLTSSATQRAFQIEREPATVRERYGRNIYGQSVLLARRLIEAGTRLVNVTWAPHANATWDTHGNNFSQLKRTLLPQFDAACSSLIVELAERRMLDRTLVAILGDFGRTPRINKAAGRDHWNDCFTVMLVGGGIRAGYVHGASDRTGSLPAADPTTPGDLIATMYRLFGIDHQQMIRDQLNRPHLLVPNGHVVADLIA